MRQWQASPQARFERLLRETKVTPHGLLVNQRAIRLVYAPRGESSGFLTLCIPEMRTTPTNAPEGSFALSENMPARGRRPGRPPGGQP